MSCKRCSASFEDKFVQCFDEQNIKMYIKRNGVVKLIYNDIVETTNFSYCPYCGKKFSQNKKCEECNNIFIPQRSDAKYCKECAIKVREKQSKEWYEKIKSDPEKFAERKEQAKIRMREIRKARKEQTDIVVKE